jgi:hypothetical protein
MKKLITIILLVGLTSMSLYAQTYKTNSTNTSFTGNNKLHATKTKVGNTLLTENKIKEYDSAVSQLQDTTLLSDVAVMKSDLYFDATTRKLQVKGNGYWYVLDIADSIAIPQSMNIVKYSEQLNNVTVWSVNNVTVTADQDIDITGDSTLDLVSITAGNLWQDITTVGNTLYYLSFDCKRGTIAEAGLEIALYDITHSSYLGSNIAYGTQTSTSAVQRVIVTFTTPVDCISLRIKLIDTALTGTVLIGRVQVSANTEPYIVTTDTVI